MIAEPDILGCIPVAGGGVVAKGSRKRRCGGCRTAVWVAPTGLEIIKSRGAMPMCLRCVAVRIVNDPSPEFVPPTEDQLDEIVSTLLLQARRHQ